MLEHVKQFAEQMLSSESKNFGPVKQQVQQLLRMRHQTRSGQADGFTISTPSASATSANGPAVQFVERLQYLSRQFACQAKTLCGPIPAQ